MKNSNCDMSVTPSGGPVSCFFKGWIPGSVYYCDSYDPDMGYWMTPVVRQEYVIRTNVSERAIGSSFHQISLDQLKSEGYLDVQLHGQKDSQIGILRFKTVPERCSQIEIVEPTEVW